MGVVAWTTGDVRHELAYKDGDWTEAPADYRVQPGDMVATDSGWTRASKDIGMMAGDYPAVLCPSSRDPNTESEGAKARRAAKAERMKPAAAAPKKSAKKSAKKKATSKES